ncbi:hypothetical protein ALC53_12668, partial [Atta colombica]
ERYGKNIVITTKSTTITIICFRDSQTNILSKANVLNILSTLGFVATYKETLMYEVVTIYHPQPDILSSKSGALIQYIADNAGINVYTIDSYNTAHIIGIIKIITPISAVIAEEPIAKYKTMSTAKDFGSSRMYP